MTATKVSTTQFVVCYRRFAYSPGRCQIGSISFVSQTLSFGTPLDVYDSATYINGVVTNLFDATDRVVLSFAVATVECSKIVVMGVSGSTLSTVTPGGLTRYEFSSMSDNLASVALTRTSVLLVYRVRHHAGVPFVSVSCSCTFQHFVFRHSRACRIDGLCLCSSPETSKPTSATCTSTRVTT